MSPSDEISEAFSLKLWLDRWFAVRWRALLTWVVLAGASVLVYEQCRKDWIEPAMSWFNKGVAGFVPVPLSGLFSAQNSATHMLFLIWFEPVVLRLNLPRAALWIGLKIGRSLAYFAAHDLVSGFLTGIFGSCPESLLGNLWALSWEMAMIPVLYGWRSRPWMCVVGLALSIIVRDFALGSLVYGVEPNRIGLGRALYVLPYAAMLLYGTRLVRREEREGR